MDGLLEAKRKLQSKPLWVNDVHQGHIVGGSGPIDGRNQITVDKPVESVRKIIGKTYA